MQNLCFQVCLVFCRLPADKEWNELPCNACNRRKLMLRVDNHLIVIVVGYIASLFYPKPMFEGNFIIHSWKKNRNNENVQ